MKFQNQALSLNSDALPADTLMVQKLVGNERMSGMFRFELDLLCEDPDLDLEKVLYSPAKLGIRVSVRLGGGRVGTATREIAGVFESFEEREQGQGWVKYHAVLVPKLWLATRSYRSRVFQNVTLDALVKAVLAKDGIDPDLDFEFQLSRPGSDGDPKTRAVYPEREYVVQYEEHDWRFLARWLEHEGVFFYFVNDGGEEKVVFGDTTSAYGKSMFGSNYPYRPEAVGDGGASDNATEEEVKSFFCRQTRLPQKVVVNDYNWRVPSARLSFEADVKDDGTGLQAEYNDHFKNEAQGKALAQLRVEELTCGTRVFHGSGSCRAFRPGTTFTLEGHFREEFNRAFLLTKVHHEAEQMISLESASVTGVKYTNTFEAIPDDHVFRPERLTDWPSIKGVVHAKIDAEGDGKYAELDEHGRYKVRLPFDEAADEAEPGKASRWIRMAQPYAGANAGMHFPLLKGTEVLIVHIDGDPDRPIIAGAVPNPETESPTTGSNFTRSSVRTASGNVMQMDDNEAMSGFVFADASGSRVMDYRWRTGAPAPSNGAGGTPTGGSGSGDPFYGDEHLVSTMWATGLSDTPGAGPAWCTYFGVPVTAPTPNSPAPTQVNTAVVQLKDTVKRFTADSGFVGLSTAATSEANPAPSSSKLLSDNTLTQANIVAMFNELVKDISSPSSDWEDRTGTKNSKTRYPSSQFPSGQAVGGSSLNGKIAALVAASKNFEATASGSTIGIDVGDTIKVTVGDQFTYTDASYDVKIGTGGYTRDETRGDGATDKFRWGSSEEYEETHGDTTKRTWTYGKENEHSYFFGRKEKWELECSGSASMAVKVSGDTENSVFGGVKEQFELSIAGITETSILVGGKLEIELGTLSVKLGLANSFEFEISTQGLLVNEEKVFLNKMTAALKQDGGYLQKQEASLNEQKAALLKKTAALLKDQASLSENDAALDKKQAALSKKIAALDKDEAALTNKIAALSDQRAVLANLSTAAFHSIQ